MLISPRNTLTDAPRTMFSQMTRYPHGPVSLAQNIHHPTRQENREQQPIVLQGLTDRRSISGEEGKPMRLQSQSGRRGTTDEAAEGHGQLHQQVGACSKSQGPVTVDMFSSPEHDA